MPSTSPSPALTRTFPTWMVGVLYSAGGAMNGFVAVSLAVLLSSRGVSIAREAEMVGLILTASYISFLLTPLVDCGLSRRVWAMLLAVLCALGLLSGVRMVDGAAAQGGHGAGATAMVLTLFGAYLCSQMYTSTIGGMVPNLVEERQQSAASAWLNVAYLAMTGLCGSLSAWEVRRFPLHVAAVLVPLPVLLSASPLLFVGHEERQPRAFRETMSRLFADLRETARQRSYLFALLVFIVPSATFALQNVFGGMGEYFHTSESVTAWSAGTGLALACALGSAIGGPLSSRFDRRLLFIAPAMLAAAGSLAMAFGPRVPWVFVGGMFLYNLMAGVNYTATSALVFQIVGRGNPLSSTQYAVCIAACNAAIASAVVMDGHGSGHGGARGALLVDAGLSLALGAVVLGLVWRFGGGFPRPVLVEAQL